MVCSELAELLAAPLTIKTRVGGFAALHADRGSGCYSQRHKQRKATLVTWSVSDIVVRHLEGVPVVRRGVASLPRSVVEGYGGCILWWKGIDMAFP
jgi:hypothetical protein